MFAVIFQAKTTGQDEDYQKTVLRMRELALAKYGCLDFIAVTEGKQEIAISYWENEAAINRWRNDPEHHFAQQRGREKWYESYIVQVVEIKREYKYNKSY
ncbi:MAG: antibiotic biosynthesis monooxygenase [Candidatus Competibacteraceae bacterium]|jgi:heme-degrading monooxygenase HmoA|nr:antibiotic biosynthesis monooxygenase [Candidatus Competibacteraceae bacterium]